MNKLLLVVVAVLVVILAVYVIIFQTSVQVKRSETFACKLPSNLLALFGIRDFGQISLLGFSANIDVFHHELIHCRDIAMSRPLKYAFPITHRPHPGPTPIVGT